MKLFFAINCRMANEPLAKWISILYRFSLMYANSFLKLHNLNAGQLPFLINIVDNPAITQEELSNLLKMDKSTTARAVKTLQLKGFIKKEKDSKDRRNHRLYPTNKALTIRDALWQKGFMWDEILLKGFDEQQKKEIRTILQKLANNAIEYFDKEKKR